jgi:hypothetical protein
MYKLLIKRLNDKVPKLEPLGTPDSAAISEEDFPTL